MKPKFVQCKLEFKSTTDGEFKAGAHTAGMSVLVKKQ